MVDEVEEGWNLRDEFGEPLCRLIAAQFVIKLIFETHTEVLTARVDDEVHFLDLALEYYFYMSRVLFKKLICFQSFFVKGFDAIFPLRVSICKDFYQEEQGKRIDDIFWPKWLGFDILKNRCLIL